MSALVLEPWQKHVLQICRHSKNWDSHWEWYGISLCPDLPKKQSCVSQTRFKSITLIFSIKVKVKNIIPHYKARVYRDSFHWFLSPFFAPSCIEKCIIIQARTPLFLLSILLWAFHLATGTESEPQDMGWWAGKGFSSWLHFCCVSACPHHHIHSSTSRCHYFCWICYKGAVSSLSLPGSLDLQALHVAMSPF